MDGKNGTYKMEVEKLNEAAQYLRTLAHPTRLRMIEMLLKGRYTVGELARACGVKHHMASEHLRLMQDRRLLVGEPDGRKMYYKVARPEVADIVAHLEAHFADSESSAGDKRATY